MRAAAILLLALLFLLLPYQARAQRSAQGGDVVTTLVNGVGKDYESAARNAGETALRNTLGSFVQSDTILKKRSEIEDGIRSEARSITSAIREYSQGTIAFLEVVERRQRDGLFEVVARVGVRKSEFQGFARRVTQGEGLIDEGLFAGLQVKKAQNQDLRSIWHTTVINPIATGEVVNISVSRPEPISETFADPCNVSTVNRLRGTLRDMGKDDFSIRNYLSVRVQHYARDAVYRPPYDRCRPGDANVFGAIVRMEMRPDFVKHLRETLVSIGRRIDGPPPPVLDRGQVLVDLQVRKNAPIGLRFTESYRVTDRYIVNVPKEEVVQMFPPVVSVVDGAENILQEVRSAPGQQTASFYEVNMGEGIYAPATLIARSPLGGIHIRTDTEFVVAFRLDDESLRAAKAIRVTPQPTHQISTGRR